jgi:hypothetical protein
MAEIDTRFLTLHPRTAVWWEQREQCMRCAHMTERGDTSNGLRKPGSETGGMRCLKVERKIGSDFAGRHIQIYCIDAREEGGKCGPAGLLFKEMKHGGEKVRKHVRATYREQPQA